MKTGDLVYLVFGNRLLRGTFMGMVSPKVASVILDGWKATSQWAVNDLVKL